MNKTQLQLISRLLNKERGSVKVGWTLTIPSNGQPIFISLQKLSEINQAGKLADTYPDIFKFEMKMWRLANLILINETKARCLGLV